MKFDAHTLALACKGILIQTTTLPLQGSICTDTRNIKEGDWFLAIAGERFDGHNFIEKAKELGAAGVIGQHVPEKWDRGFVQVEDSIVALQNAARYTRQKFSGRVIAITGSAGKTTTRALVASVLQKKWNILETHGNFNNHIGLPLTILRSTLSEDVWILELGMNHLGEIHLLQEIAQPHIRVITNVGAAHLEGVGDIDGVAKAKGEIFDGAKEDDLCLINADDVRICALNLPEKTRSKTFGFQGDFVRIIKAHIDVTQLHTVIEMETPKGSITSAIPSPGLHLASNVAIAVAIGCTLQCSLKEISEGIAQYQPVGARLRVEEGPRNTLLLNDAYNANPLSTKASLKTLSALQPHTRFALLGDMLELGKESLAEHCDVLKFALSLNLEGIGVCGKDFLRAAQQLDSPPPSLFFAENATLLGKQLLPKLKGKEILLLKGSRGSKMETLLSVLEEK